MKHPRGLPTKTPPGVLLRTSPPPSRAPPGTTSGPCLPSANTRTLAKAPQREPAAAIRPRRTFRTLLNGSATFFPRNGPAPRTTAIGAPTTFKATTSCPTVRANTVFPNHPRPTENWPTKTYWNLDWVRYSRLVPRKQMPPLSFVYQHRINPPPPPATAAAATTTTTTTTTTSRPSVGGRRRGSGPEFAKDACLRGGGAHVSPDQV